jgi:RimJ/RimL family protein N-acetyltransferase
MNSGRNRGEIWEEKMMKKSEIIFETERLLIRMATETDIEFFHGLWTNPQVMVHVGYPNGIPLTMEEMKVRPFEQGESEFEALLVVELKENGKPVGECKLGVPDEDGVVEPDIKLLPEFWGHKYGREVWVGLVDYLFRNTDCDAIRTTPNINNTAAIEMYESTGAVQEGQDVFAFPESMRDFTNPVTAYKYRLYRKDWGGR